MIIFVGDKPSKHNISKDIPFVGTKSYKRLLEWIWQLDIDVTDIFLANTQHVTRGKSDWRPDVQTLNSYMEIQEEDSVVALGTAASKALGKLSIPHFKLPHPSGL